MGDCLSCYLSSRQEEFPSEESQICSYKKAGATEKERTSLGRVN